MRKMQCVKMTAGSWIYIGSEIVREHTETFVEAGRQRYGGAGGTLGADCRATRRRRATAPRRLAGACSLTVECQQSRIVSSAYSLHVDERAATLDDALARVRATPARESRVRVALCANAADIPCRDLVNRGVRGRGDRSDQRPRSLRLLPLRLALGGIEKTRNPIPTGRCEQRNVPWRRMFGRCWRSVKWACRPLTMAAIFVR